MVSNFADIGPVLPADPAYAGRALLLAYRNLAGLPPAAASSECVSGTGKGKAQPAVCGFEVHHDAIDVAAFDRWADLAAGSDEA
jgi:hypothetical protein